jgi:hypothetical protein
MMTIMLDVGASEWKAEETQGREALLAAWKELLYWLVKEKI